MNKTKLLILAAVSIIILGPLTIHIIKLTYQTENELLLPYNDVRGMAIHYNHQLYTLNFEQQKQVIRLLNLSETIDPPSKLNKSKDSFDYVRLFIYRFDKPTLEMIPIHIENDQLVFKIKEWNKNYTVYIREFHNLLSQIH